MGLYGLIGVAKWDFPSNREVHDFRKKRLQKNGGTKENKLMNTCLNYLKKTRLIIEI